MKYENASDILPQALLKEIQKYAAGKLLYIPSGEVKRAWGEASGYRAQLKKRNRMIRNKYAHGITISELADENFLSLDSIKKIIYSKNNDNDLRYIPTVASAVDYANAGLIEEWIQFYLLLTLKAAPAVQNLIEREPIYFGVVKFPLRLVQPEALHIRDNDAGEEEDDDDDASKLPPLLVQYTEGKFYCTLQRELFASLKERKTNAYPSIIILKENTEYKRFMKHFGNVFIFVGRA